MRPPRGLGGGRFRRRGHGGRGRGGDRGGSAMKSRAGGKGSWRRNAGWKQAFGLNLVLKFSPSWSVSDIVGQIFSLNYFDFSKVYMDSNGSLTMLELAALLRAIGLKQSGDQIHVLLEMDSNRNGAVEFDELASILPELTEDILNSQERLTEVFQMFDRDGNGYITAAELAGCMDKLGHPLTYSELTDIIRKADFDGDGVISFSEFSAAMGKINPGISRHYVGIMTPDLRLSFLCRNRFVR
ncbi:putative calcium-binding protein CML12 [Hibiscus syriacus]|uniref:Calcium-binding protein CML12 n=1 Tax=Hibiscus syriacus TaxID=106335 RepID=A0A6A2YXH4_HIBSY|nr:putative calcium-binding protein CML12 [Hibiscus syriacus]